MTDIRHCPLSCLLTLFPDGNDNGHSGSDHQRYDPNSRADAALILFAWEQLAETARSDLDAARRRLMDILSSYAGFRKCRLVLVFDGYKAKGNPGEKSQWNNIQVVFTPEGQTADAYIEALVYEIGSSYAVRVATSDSLVQLSSLRSGVLRMSARELLLEIETAHEEMKNHLQA